MLVRCVADPIALAGANGSVPSVQATCPRCGHTTESYGTSEASIRRCLVLLHEECPADEYNFYVEDAPGLSCET
jgi:hypothetical protein